MYAYILIIARTSERSRAVCFVIRRRRAVPSSTLCHILIFTFSRAFSVPIGEGSREDVE
jgi:hypothetical protein